MEPADSNGSGDGKLAHEDKPDDWQHTKKKVLERLHYVLDNSSFSDCKVVVGSGENEMSFEAHRMVLSMTSSFFQSKIFGDEIPKECIEIPDVEPAVFKMILQYMYTDKIDLMSSDEACKLLEAAKKCEVVHLQELCRDYLANNMSPDVIWKMLQVSEEPALYAKSMELLRRETSKVLEHPSFLKVGKDLLLEVLDQEHLNIKECDLFKAVTRWSEMQCEMVGRPTDNENKRQLLGLDVVGKIRYLAFSSKEFSEGPALSGILSKPEIVGIFMNLGSPGVCPLPEGFSQNSKPRGLKELRCVRNRIGPPVCAERSTSQNTGSIFSSNQNGRIFGGSKRVFGQGYGFSRQNSSVLGSTYQNSSTIGGVKAFGTSFTKIQSNDLFGNTDQKPRTSLDGAKVFGHSFDFGQGSHLFGSTNQNAHTFDGDDEILQHKKANVCVDSNVGLFGNQLPSGFSQPFGQTSFPNTSLKKCQPAPIFVGSALVSPSKNLPTPGFGSAPIIPSNNLPMPVFGSAPAPPSKILPAVGSLVSSQQSDGVSENQPTSKNSIGAQVTEFSDTSPQSEAEGQGQSSDEPENALESEHLGPCGSFSFTPSLFGFNAPPSTGFFCNTLSTPTKMGRKKSQNSMSCFGNQFQRQASIFGVSTTFTDPGNALFHGETFRLSVVLSHDIMLLGIQVPSCGVIREDGPDYKPFSKEYKECLTVSIIDVASRKKLGSTVFKERVKYFSTVDIYFGSSVHLKKSVEYCIEIITEGSYIQGSKLQTTVVLDPVTFTFKDYVCPKHNTPNDEPFSGDSSLQESENSFVTQLIYAL